MSAMKNALHFGNQYIRLGSTYTEAAIKQKMFMNIPVLGWHFLLSCPDLGQVKGVQNLAYRVSDLGFPRVRQWETLCLYPYDA